MQDNYKWCWMNGEILESAHAKVSVFDRGFLYGDGLFETIRIHNGGIFQWQRHWARLIKGCSALGIQSPCSEDDFHKVIGQLITKNQITKCMARIHLSRGAGPRGYLPPKNAKITALITLHPAPELSPNTPRSWNLIVSKMRTPSFASSSQWKTTNKLFQTLIKQEANTAGADDAIILNENDHITELSSGNLFLTHQGVILTPPVDTGILPGTTRELILELAMQLGLDCRESYCDLSTLREASSAFASLSTLGLVHIQSIEGRELNLQQEERQLYQEYLKRLDQISPLSYE